MPKDPLFCKVILHPGCWVIFGFSGEEISRIPVHRSSRLEVVTSVWPVFGREERGNKIAPSACSPSPDAGAGAFEQGVRHLADRAGFAIPQRERRRGRATAFTQAWRSRWEWQIDPLPPATSRAHTCLQDRRALRLARKACWQSSHRCAAT